MESMEYEQARNLTLLFFFERLVDKNEPRTLHDLSCQFGAPGFTKEMRQIAGGSESGESRHGKHSGNVQLDTAPLPKPFIYTGAIRVECHRLCRANLTLGRSFAYSSTQFKLFA